MAEVTALTAVVLAEKVAVVAPCSTVTLPATVAAALLLDRVTTAPPTGAGLLIVTVPVEDVPPVTLAGFIDTAVRAGGLMVNVAVCVPL